MDRQLSSCTLPAEARSPPVVDLLGLSLEAPPSPCSKSVPAYNEMVCWGHGDKKPSFH